MEKIIVPKDEMPFSLLEEIGISWSSIAFECIQKKFTELSILECEKILDDNYDKISDVLYDLRDSDFINDNCIGEEEIDESSGTWGYLHFEFNDVKKTKSILEDETRDLLEIVINEI
jgi:hypothetical protein